jgi:hypothetical protein
MALFHAPAGRRSRFNAPSPAAGGGTGCALAPGPAEGTRAGLVGAARASPARIPGRRRDAAHTHNEDADRLSAKTGEPRGRESAAEGASTIGLAKDHAQRFLVRINDVVDESLARGRMDHQEFDRSLRSIMQRHFRHDAVRRLGGTLPTRASPPYWASAFSAAINAFMSSSAFEGRHASPRLANSIARPTPWAVSAASCATI